MPWTCFPRFWWRSCSLQPLRGFGPESELSFPPIWLILVSPAKVAMWRVFFFLVNNNFVNLGNIVSSCVLLWWDSTSPSQLCHGWHQSSSQLTPSQWKAKADKVIYTFFFCRMKLLERWNSCRPLWLSVQPRVFDLCKMLFCSASKDQGCWQFKMVATWIETYHFGDCPKLHWL